MSSQSPSHPRQIRCFGTWRPPYQQSLLQVNPICGMGVLPAYSPELQPAEHLWPLTNTVLANRHFASIDELEDVQAERCVALQARPDLIRSTTLFHWWPRRIKKRQGPRRN